MLGLIAAFWAPAEAYRRRALYRLQILIAALGIPLAFAVLFYALSHFAGGRSPVVLAVAAVVLMVVYLGLAFGLVVFAHHAQLEPDPPGFPIEPIPPGIPPEKDSE